MRAASPESYLVLLSAATEERRERSRAFAPQLADSIDWDRFATRLAARRLLTQLGDRVLELVGERAPTSFREAVAQAVVEGRRHAGFLELFSQRTIQSLENAGVIAMGLKGASLAEAIYGDPGRRVSSDVDLLVLAEDLPAAVDLTTGSGYEPPDDHLGGDGLPLLHYSLKHERGALPTLELHWRVHWYETLFAREALLRAEPGPDGRRRLQPVDDLAFLLLFYSRDGFVNLRLATDIAAWWDAFGALLAPGALAETIARHPALEPALTAAVGASERVVGLPGERLLGGRAPRVRGRTRAAIGLVNPNPRQSATQVYAEMGLVDCLLTPRGGRRDLIRRQFLVPRQVRAQRAAVAGERRVVTPLGHCVRVLARYAIALPRAVRGPELGRPTALSER